MCLKNCRSWKFILELLKWYLNLWMNFLPCENIVFPSLEKLSVNNVSRFRSKMAAAKKWHRDADLGGKDTIFFFSILSGPFCIVVDKPLIFYANLWKLHQVTESNRISNLISGREISRRFYIFIIIFFYQQHDCFEKGRKKHGKSMWLFPLFRVPRSSEKKSIWKMCF